MITKNLGGNRARYLNVLRGNIKFSGSKYKYSHININDKEKKIKLNYFTVYVLSKKNKSQLLINKKVIKINEGDCINFYNQKINRFSSQSGDIKLLISGVKKNKKEKKRIELIKKNKLYTVKKPWGYEKWLNGRGKYYAFKKIFLKSSFKTSLQYHRYKCETNLLFSGKAQLVYKINKRIHNKKVQNKDLKKENLKFVSEIFVKPNTLHRIIAKTNIQLFETSTPHLDDVIRVSDDKNRPSGLIKLEHQK